MPRVASGAELRSAARLAGLTAEKDFDAPAGLTAERDFDTPRGA